MRQAGTRGRRARGAGVHEPALTAKLVARFQKYLPQGALPVTGGPGYWRNETSGVLAPVVTKFLENKQPLTGEEIGIMRAYLLQWILHPVWSTNPHEDEEGRRTLWELRVRARKLETISEITEWLSDALDFGLDPL